VGLTKCELFQHRQESFLVFDGPVICRVQAWLRYRAKTARDAKATAGSLSGDRGYGVCIYEHLTASQDAIYRQAKEVRRQHPDRIVDCWTVQGQTFVRTSQGEEREFDPNLISAEDTETKCVVM